VEESRSDTLASVLLATGDRFCSTAAAARRCSCPALDRGDGGVRARRRPSRTLAGTGGSDADARVLDATALTSLIFFSEEPRPPPDRPSAAGVDRFSCVVDGEDSSVLSAPLAGCQDLYRDSLSELAQPDAIRLFPYDG